MTRPERRLTKYRLAKFRKLKVVIIHQYITKPIITMNSTILKFLPFMALLIFTAACNDDDDSADADPFNFAGDESDYVSIALLRDNSIDVLRADNGQIRSSVDEGLPQGARFYTSSTGRFLVVVNRNGDEVRFFDSGVYFHIDHTHDDPSEWLGTTVEALEPTHFKSSGDHMVIFNDGDGSITYVNEEQLEFANYTPDVIQVDKTVAHHGVAFRFSNGQFVTTFKDETEPEGLPRSVRFIDSDGSVIGDNGGVETAGIHGSAVNGTYGAFGSRDGVIIVDGERNIDLVENTGKLDTARNYWIATMYGHDNADLFFGRASNLGAFVVDPVEKTINVLYEGSDIAGAMFSFDGEYFLLHTSDNKIRVYNANATNAEPLIERVVEMVDIPAVGSASGRSSRSEIEVLRQMNQPSPVLICSEQYLYALAPNRQQIKVLRIRDLTHVRTIELGSTVNSIAKVGFTD